MGVEYRHFLVVEEPSWKPKPDTAMRVDALLRKWRIVDRYEKVVDLTKGEHTEVVGGTTSTVGSNLVFVYAGVTGKPVIGLAGPSLYAGEIDDHDRYTQNTALLVGNDFRVQWSSESIWFKLVTKPKAKGRVVEANDEEEGPFDLLYSESYPSEGASPPVVRVHISDHAKANIAWKTCLGYWRAAVVIDFGKDLPAFVNGIHALPEREFVSELAEAFRGSIIEIGEFY